MFRFYLLVIISFIFIFSYCSRDTSLSATGTTAAASSTPTPTPSVSGTWLSQTQGWIYPGSPACDAPTTYSSQKIYTLKPEYLSVDSSGNLNQVTVSSDGCNGYSAANAADVKAHSTTQFVTISANPPGIGILVGTAQNRSTAIQTILNLLNQIGFTGVELDFEGFSSWSSTDYSNFKTFLNELGTSLHSHGYLLMVDGPGIQNAADQTGTLWKYEDISVLPVDYVVVMAYDYQYGPGAGSPVAPNSWVLSLIAWVKAKVADPTKVVIGMPAYGYHAKTGAFQFTNDTWVQSAQMNGYSTATRDSSSFEMNWSFQGVSYFYQDSSSLNSKRSLIESQGITKISVWHLGGNNWFSGKSEP